MDTQTLVWILTMLVMIIGGLLTVLGFFIRGWISKTDKKIEATDVKLDGKLDKILCGERHEDTKEKLAELWKHKHAPIYQEGRGGEVITP
jgi:hypothetical protein